MYLDLTRDTYVTSRISDDLRAWMTTNKIGHRHPQSLQPGVKRPLTDFQGPQKITADYVHASTWGSVYNAGYLIHPQHRSSGMATWTAVASGTQMWTFLRPQSDDPECRKAALRLLATATPRESPKAFENMFDVGTLMLTTDNVLYAHRSVLLAFLVPD